MLDKALRNSEIPWWEWEIPSNKVFFNDKKVTMLGYDVEDFRNVGYEAFTEILHPEDYERTMDAMRGHLSGELPLYQVDYRIKKADGTYTWYMDRGGIIERDKEGKPLKLRGVVLDLGKNLNEKSRDKTAFNLIRSSLPAPGRDDIIVLCSSCKKVKLKDGTWTEVDGAFDESIFARISHGICDICMKKLYPEFDFAEG